MTPEPYQNIAQRHSEALLVAVCERPTVHWSLLVSVQISLGCSLAQFMLGERERPLAWKWRTLNTAKLIFLIQHTSSPDSSRNREDD